MISGKSKGALLILGLLLGFTGVWHLQHGIDTMMTPLQIEQDELMLSNSKFIKAASLEYAPLMADVYWTRVVQYYGRKSARPNQSLTQLWALLDAATTLDPHLLVAYRFGAMFLAEPRPTGAGRADLAVELIERGIRENPEYWRFYQDLGNVYYFDSKDYQKASAAFLEGSKKPGAQEWMKVMAARVLEGGESRATSMFLWGEIYQTSKDPDMRENALTHMQLLKVEDDCEKLDALVAEFTKRTGLAPQNLRALVSAGLLRGIPVDPMGYPYVLDAQGKVDLNEGSPLVRKRAVYGRFLGQAH